jgi:hypothetical protein
MLAQNKDIRLNKKEIIVWSKFLEVMLLSDRNKLVYDNQDLL